MKAYAILIHGKNHIGLSADKNNIDEYKTFRNAMSYMVITLHKAEAEEYILNNPSQKMVEIIILQKV